MTATKTPSTQPDGAEQYQGAAVGASPSCIHLHTVTGLDGRKHMQRCDGCLDPGILIHFIASDVTKYWTGSHLQPMPLYHKLQLIDRLPQHVNLSSQPLPLLLNKRVLARDSR